MYDLNCDGSLGGWFRCFKKDCIDFCIYVLKLEKWWFVKGVVVWFRRFEIMVCDMMDGDGNVDCLVV